MIDNETPIGDKIGSEFNPEEYVHRQCRADTEQPGKPHILDVIAELFDEPKEAGESTDESDVHMDDDEEESSGNNDDNSPGFDSCLLHLPDGLGLLQDYIYGQMIYPERTMAGITALFYMTHYAQTRAIVKSSLGDLAFSEYYVVMAKTTFGKERLRQALDTLHSRVVKSQWLGRLPGADFQRAIPASPQGLHALLEENEAQTFMSDEFAEYLIQSTKNGGDTYKRATIGYLMEIYTKAFSSVCVPNAISHKYKAVDSPRVTIFATTTGERLAESLSMSQADSGTYNRFVSFVGAQQRIPKKYDGYVFEPSSSLLDFMEWLLTLSNDCPVNLDKEATAYFIEFDSGVIEPLKFDDPQLAGRLSEQALKMAGLIALGAQRTEIIKDDLVLAYDIRLGIYKRARKYFNDEGSMNGEDTTMTAFNQVSKAIIKKKIIPLSLLPNYSRKYKALKLSDQKTVLDHLGRSGIAKVTQVKGGSVLTQL